MSTELTWEAARDEARRIESAIATAPLADLPALGARAEQLTSHLRDAAARRGLTPPSPTLRRTAEWLERHLRVGGVPVPDGAPEALRTLVEAYRHRRVAPDTIESFVAELAVLTTAAHDAAANVERVNEELAVAERHRDLLRRYEAALDALTGREA